MRPPSASADAAQSNHPTTRPPGDDNDSGGGDAPAEAALTATAEAYGKYGETDAKITANSMSLIIDVFYAAGRAAISSHPNFLGVEIGLLVS